MDSLYLCCILVQVQRLHTRLAKIGTRDSARGISKTVESTVSKLSWETQKRKLLHQRSNDGARRKGHCELREAKNLQNRARD